MGITTKIVVKTGNGVELTAYLYITSSVGMETFYYNCFTGAVGSASNSLSVDVCQS